MSFRTSRSGGYRRESLYVVKMYWEDTNREDRRAARAGPRGPVRCVPYGRCPLLDGDLPPSHVARKMLDLKRVDYELVNVLTLNLRVHHRLAGITGGTVT